MVSRRSSTSSPPTPKSGARPPSSSCTTRTTASSDHMPPPVPPQTAIAQGQIHRRHPPTKIFAGDCWISRRPLRPRPPRPRWSSSPPWSKGGYVNSRGLRPHLAHPIHRKAFRRQRAQHHQVAPRRHRRPNLRLQLHLAQQRHRGLTQHHRLHTTRQPASPRLRPHPTHRSGGSHTRARHSSRTRRSLRPQREGQANAFNHTLRVDFANTGKSTAVYHVRSGNTQTGPWTFTVEPDAELSESWNLNPARTSTTSPSTALTASCAPSKAAPLPPKRSTSRSPPSTTPSAPASPSKSSTEDQPASSPSRTPTPAKQHRTTSRPAGHTNHSLYTQSVPRLVRLHPSKSAPTPASNAASPATSKPAKTASPIQPSVPVEQSPKTIHKFSTGNAHQTTRLNLSKQKKYQLHSGVFPSTSYS